MKAGVYLRVSTERQDEANQEPACLATCEARGWEPVIFREREGATKKRPEWERLMEAARRGEIRAVVFYSIHRIGRRRFQIAADLADLTRWGMAIVSTREKFLDVDNTPELSKMREMLIQWWGWFAEQERDELIDRTKKAMGRIQERIAKAGAHTSPRSGRTITKLGRPGYSARWKARALELAREGAKPTRIAQQLQQEGSPPISRATVHLWLTDEQRKAAAAAAADDDGPAAVAAAG